MMVERILWSWLMCVLVVSPANVCADVPSAPLVRAGRQLADVSRWDDVSQWHIETESQRIPADGSRSDGDGFVVRERLAVTAGNRLYLFSGHNEASIGSDWRDEPYNLEITLRDGTLTRYRKFCRHVAISELPAGESIPEPVATDVVFCFVPVWPLTRHPPPRNNLLQMHLVLNDALESGLYSATGERRQIAGESCIEVASNSGHDTIWLSESKPLCMMHRQWRDPASGKPLGEMETIATKQFAPGLWLPAEIECTNYKAAGRSEGSMLRTRTRVLEFRINADVSADLFDARLDAGTIQYMKRNDFQQIIPGGTGQLDHVAAFYRDTMGLPAFPNQQSPGAEDARPPLLATLLTDYRRFAWLTAGFLGGSAIALLLAWSPATKKMDQTDDEDAGIL